MSKSLIVLTPSFALLSLVFILHAQAPDAAKAKAKGPRVLGMEDGLTFFQTRCMNCHGNPNVNAPSPNAIRAMTVEKIYESLSTGSMKDQAASLTDEEKRR